MNTYGYVDGNPLYWADPYGLCPPAGWKHCREACGKKGTMVRDCFEINLGVISFWGCDCEESCKVDDYENPGTHDPDGGPNNYDPTKETLPENHEELWRNSRPDPKNPDKTRWATEGTGKKARHHRFQGGNGKWHWNGSSGGTTQSGKPRGIPPQKLPKF